MILPKLNVSVEKWKYNTDYGVYVSNMGNFKREDKKDLPKRLSGGYFSVMTKCGWRYAHRLVALTWMPIPDAENLTVDHKDSNKRNNAASNLEWVTQEENQRRAEKIILSQKQLADMRVDIAPKIKHNKNEIEADGSAIIYTKENINIRFNTMADAIVFCRLVLRANNSNRDISTNILNACNNGHKYLKANWGKEEN